MSASDDEVPVKDIWRMLSITSLPLLSDPLSPDIAVPVMFLSVDQIKLFKNYSYMIWPCDKKKKLDRNIETKNVNMNVKERDLLIDRLTWC